MAMSTMSNTSSPDRVLKLGVINDKLPKTSTGMVDTSLFTGENNIHARIDGQTMMWTVPLRKRAQCPGPLRTRSGLVFLNCTKTLELYFANRNIKITEVIQSK